MKTYAFPVGDLCTSSLAAALIPSTLKVRFHSHAGGLAGRRRSSSWLALNTPVGSRKPNSASSFFVLSELALPSKTGESPSGSSSGNALLTRARSTVRLAARNPSPAVEAAANDEADEITARPATSAVEG